MTASKRLRKLVKARGAQSALAKRLGVQEPMISKLVSGKAKPSLQLATRIEEATGIPAKEWAA